MNSSFITSSFREQLLTPKVKLILSFPKNNQQLFPSKNCKKAQFF